MAKRGTMIWVPRVVMDEVENISQENRIPTRADAFKEMVKYSRVGREVDRIRRFNFVGVGKPQYPPDFFNELNKGAKKWRQKTY